LEAKSKERKIHGKTTTLGGERQKDRKRRGAALAQVLSEREDQIHCQF